MKEWLQLTAVETEIFYNYEDVKKAAQLLLEADLEGENYNYDLIEISRQTMTDHAYYLLKEIKKSYEENDNENYERLRDEFLSLILDLDALLNTDENFMLGTWTEMARAIADEVAHLFLVYYYLNQVVFVNIIKI